MFRKSAIMILLCLIIFSSHTISAESRGYIVKIKDGASFDNKAGLKVLSETCGLYYAGKLSDIENIREYVEYYEEDMEIELIEESVKLMSVPIDPYYTSQTGLQMVNAQGAWNLEAYGNDIKVAVIDSGCNPHDDLKNNLLPGKNCVDGSSDVTDGHGHGTNVCGIIAAEMNGIGVTGIAPKAKIVPLKCFNQNTTSLSIIESAVDEAVNNFGCKVINMSIGSVSSRSSFEAVIGNAYQQGVIVVAAVGNNGNKDNSLNYPAAYDSVIGVGSVNSSKTRSNFSQHNSSVFVTAPGESVMSTHYGGGYSDYLSGTSQATPFVSGLAAIALSIDPSLTVERFKNLLRDSAEDLGPEGWDEDYGYGFLNAGAAMELLASEKDIYVSPLNDNGGEAYVCIRNNSENTLSAMSIFALYGGGALLNAAKTSLSLNENESVVVSFPHVGESISHFLWDNNLKPLSGR